MIQCTEALKTKSTSNLITLKDSIYLCNNFLFSIKGSLTNEDLIIMDIYPMYNPNSNIVNYYEFKIGTETNNNGGYVIISMSMDNHPIVEFSLEGDSYFNRFKKKTEVENLKVFRFHAGYYSCEDINGKYLDSIGIPNLYNSNGNLKCYINNCMNNCMNSYNKIDSYEELKNKFVERKKSREEQEIIRQEWDFMLTNQINNNEFTLFKSGFSNEVINITSQDVYTHYKAQGSDNQSDFTQLNPGEPPNYTNYYSGSCATAWMNLLGWHNLNFTPGLLQTESKSNNSYTNALTMQLHNYLETYHGRVELNNVKKGLNFIREQLNFSATSEEYIFLGCEPNEYHCFNYTWQYIQKYIVEKKLPVIVLYGSIYDYAIAYEIASVKNPGEYSPHLVYLRMKIFQPFGNFDVFLNGYECSELGYFFGLNKCVPLISLDRLEEQPEFEADLSLKFPPSPPVEAVVPRSIKTNKMIIYNGIAILKSYGALNNGIFRTTISFLVGSRSFALNDNLQISARASLASISDNSAAVNCLFAVDSVQAYRDALTGRIRVDIRVALMDIDAYLDRISYQVIVFAEL